MDMIIKPILPAAFPQVYSSLAAVITLAWAFTRTLYDMY